MLTAAREAFAAAVDRAGGLWLGELSDQPTVRAVVRAASALVHLSAAEGQSLAVLEALAEGTPVAASPLPANRELERRYPGLAPPGRGRTVAARCAVAALR